MECEEVAGSAAEVGAARSKPSDWKILSYLGYLLLLVSILLLKRIFCSESPDQMLGSVFPENKCLAVAEAAEHVIKGCHMGHLLTMKNECTICQAVIEMGEQFHFSLPLDLAICIREHKQFLALLLLAWIYSTLDLHMDIESKCFMLWLNNMLVYM